MCNRQHKCEDCGDKLIHQWNRGQDESSSAFGQFIHDEVTQRTSIVDADIQLIDGHPVEMLESQVHQLHFIYGDIQRFRVIEHKPFGGGLSRAQKWVLPVWRKLIDLGIKDRHISTGSGLYVVEGDPPFDEVIVTKYTEHNGEERKNMGRDEYVGWMGGPRG